MNTNFSALIDQLKDSFSSELEQLKSALTPEEKIQFNSFQTEVLQIIDDPNISAQQKIEKMQMIQLKVNDSVRQKSVKKS